MISIDGSRLLQFRRIILIFVKETAWPFKQQEPILRAKTNLYRGVMESCRFRSKTKPWSRCVPLEHMFKSWQYWYPPLSHRLCTFKTFFSTLYCYFLKTFVLRRLQVFWNYTISPSQVRRAFFMYLRAIFCTFQISVDFYFVPVGGRGGAGEGEGARRGG